MKKRKTVFVTCCLMCLFVFAAVVLGQKLMNVQVKETQIRSAASFLGKIITKLDYAKEVEVLEEKGAWSRVSVVNSGAEGWVHTSALTKKKIILNPGKNDVKRAASSDEIALAGKGFAEVEEKFKKENSHVDYNTVDKMEKIVVSQKQIIMFVKGGQLEPEGGFK